MAANSGCRLRKSAVVATGSGLKQNTNEWLGCTAADCNSALQELSGWRLCAMPRLKTSGKKFSKQSRPPFCTCAHRNFVLQTANDLCLRLLYIDCFPPVRQLLASHCFPGEDRIECAIHHPILTFLEQEGAMAFIMCLPS